MRVAQKLENQRKLHSRNLEQINSENDSLIIDKERASIPELAAAYAYGIARNHPFVDGNKRTALAISLLFVKLNQLELVCSAEDLYKTLMSLAEGSLSETDLSTWFGRWTKPIQQNL